jgi:hypothetical protein
VHGLLVMAVQVRINALLFDDEHALARKASTWYSAWLSSSSKLCHCQVIMRCSKGGEAAA